MKEGWGANKILFASLGAILITGLVIAAIAVSRRATPSSGLTPLANIDDDPRFAYLDNYSDSTVPPPGTHAGETLVEERGQGDQVFDLVVPAGCNRQLLAVTGWPDETGVYAWLRFQVTDEGGGRAAYTGPENVSEITEGEFVWTLGPGDYLLEIGGDNARWNFALTCQ